ncbi:MAG TPA: hypothetical protein VKP65_22955 [Rhodothermales bacterium]|nr:hypothetical protein [Rhodothermales bacterium]
MQKRLIPLVCCLLFGLTQHASAQAFGVLEGLFSSVNSVSFNLQGGWLDDKKQLSSFSEGVDLFGLGTEVFITLPAPEGTYLELALGTSYLRGFEATEPSLDLRSSLRTLPSVAVYAALFADRSAFQPYMGVTFGLTELWRSQAYDVNNLEYGLKAQTYEYGLTLGINRDLSESIYVFLEGNYRRRRFASLDWDFPGDSQLPTDWPRTLNLSGFGLSAGVQFALEEERRETRTPLAGTWSLVQMDGQDLPVLYMQEARTLRTSMRQEILTGTLVLRVAPDTTYRLVLQRQDIVVDENDHVREVAHPQFIEEMGTYTANGDMIRLTPTGQTTTHLLERRRNDLVLQLGDTRHILLFKK